MLLFTLPGCECGGDILSYCRLHDLRQGDAAQLCSFELMDVRHARKLLALGILPGATVKVMQVFPCYVIQMDNAQFALDFAIAGQIRVRRH